ncbi:hypothetical protein [Chryseobacterium sp. ISL-6]|uniref:hypothetical protein n=1 Tax=Chryseobacterium sp. ISL-6 TaxID=2819143 RepID=UPI001BE54AAB|nr:hypothetical protein [Chryseobacterium sp. ISL-6]MBT2621185.1 hypothetical protein [Chryseobacterium sp. ISL-6]
MSTTLEKMHGSSFNISQNTDDVLMDFHISDGYPMQLLLVKFKRDSLLRKTIFLH